MMDYNEENSDNDTHTSNRKNNKEEETEDYSVEDSAEESQIKKNDLPDNLDPLTKAFNSFHSFQEALEKELQKFQELGKEPISSLTDETENNSCIHEEHGQASESSLSGRFGSENMGVTSRDSEILNLMNNVEHLEMKLEETKSILEVKESKIHELKSTISFSETHNGRTQIKIEDIFQQKIESEIEYLILSRSVETLKRQIKVIEKEKILSENQAHKMLSKLGKAETKAENIKKDAKDLQNHCVEITEVKSFKKRLFKTTSCLLLQSGLLFMLFNFQLMSDSDIVVPT